MTKVAPAQVAAGAQVLYNLTIVNAGTDTATGVVLSDILPPNTTYVSSTPAGSNSAGVVTWNVGSVPVGGSISYLVLADVASPLPNGTPLVNAASVRANENPPTGATATTRVVSAPVFVLTKTAASPIVSAGASILYTITYQNVGNEDSIATRLTDFVPKNTVLDSSSGSPTPDEQGGGDDQGQSSFHRFLLRIGPFGHAIVRPF